MLFIEFETNLHYGLNKIRYRDIENDDWHNLYVDIETLNLLINNFGIISTKKLPNVRTNCDNESTSKTIKIQYCDTNIEMYCGNKEPFYLPLIELD